MTITYLLNGAGGTDSGCTPALGNNEQALRTRTDTTNVSRDVPANTTDELSLAWTTEPSNPDVTDWPSGDYVGSLSVTAITSRHTLNIRLRQVQSGCTLRTQIGSDGPNITSTGVHSHTVNTDPASGASGDRFQIIIIADNSHGHAAQTYTISGSSASSFIEGPWSDAITVLPQVLTGHNYFQPTSVLPDQRILASFLTGHAFNQPASVEEDQRILSQFLTGDNFYQPASVNPDQRILSQFLSGDNFFQPASVEEDQRILAQFLTGDNFFQPTVNQAVTVNAQFLSGHAHYAPTVTTVQNTYCIGPVSDNTTSNSYVAVSGASLSFTPGSTSEDWLIIVSGNIASSVSGSHSQANARVRLNGSTTLCESDAYFTVGGTGDKANIGTIHHITGTTAEQTIALEFLATSGTTTVDDVRIMAMLIPTGADFQYVEDLNTENFTGVDQQLEALTWTPSSAGDYVCIGAWCSDENPGNAGCVTWLNEPDGTDQPADKGGTQLEETRGALQANVWMFGEVNLAASSQTIDIRGDSSGGGAAASRTHWRKICAFRTDAFNLFEKVEELTNSTTSSTTYQEKVSLSTTLPLASSEHAFLQCIRTHGAADHSGEHRLAAANIYENSHDNPSGSYTDTPMVGHCLTTDAVQTLSTGAKNGGGTAGTINYADARIWSFRYDPPPAPLTVAVPFLAGHAHYIPKMDPEYYIPVKQWRHPITKVEPTFLIAGLGDDINARTDEGHSTLCTWSHDGAEPDTVIKGGLVYDGRDSLGNTRFRARFNPKATGVWTLATSGSTESALNGLATTVRGLAEETGFPARGHLQRSSGTPTVHKYANSDLATLLMSVTGTPAQDIDEALAESLSVSLEYKDNSPSADTIERTIGSFLDDGWIEGMEVNVSDTASNDGQYTSDPAVAITATVITLVSGDSLTNEGPVSSSIESERVAWEGFWNHSPSVAASDPELGSVDFTAITAELDRFVGATSVHGFIGMEVYVGGGWFNNGTTTGDTNPFPTSDDDLSLQTFRALEEFIDAVYRRGGCVSVMYQGDEGAGNESALPGGYNGTEATRLQRYIWSRLGPIPGWRFRYGFDVWEFDGGGPAPPYPIAGEVAAVVSDLKDRCPYDILLGARNNHDNMTEVIESTTDCWELENYKPGASVSRHTASHPGYDEVRTWDPAGAPGSKPVFCADQYRVRPQNDVARNYAPEETSVLLPYAFICGLGAGGGQYADMTRNPAGNNGAPSRIKEYADFANTGRATSNNYNNPTDYPGDADERLRISKVFKFFEWRTNGTGKRYTESATPRLGSPYTDYNEDSPVSESGSVGLEIADRNYVLYEESTNSITVDLSGTGFNMSADTPAIAVRTDDDGESYTEVFLGKISIGSGSQEISLPSTGNWLVHISTEYLLIEAQMLTGHAIYQPASVETETRILVQFLAGHDFYMPVSVLPDQRILAQFISGHALYNPASVEEDQRILAQFLSGHNFYQPADVSIEIRVFPDFLTGHALYQPTSVLPDQRILAQFITGHAHYLPTAAPALRITPQAITGHNFYQPDSVSAGIVISAQFLAGHNFYQPASVQTALRVLPQKLTGNSFFQPASVLPDQRILAQFITGNAFYQPDDIIVPITINAQFLTGHNFFQPASVSSSTTILPQFLTGNALYQPASVLPDQRILAQFVSGNNFYQPQSVNAAIRILADFLSGHAIYSPTAAQALVISVQFLTGNNFYQPTVTTAPIFIPGLTKKQWVQPIVSRRWDQSTQSRTWEQ